MKNLLTRKEFERQVRKSKFQTYGTGGGYDLNENGGFKKIKTESKLISDIIRNTKSW